MACSTCPDGGGVSHPITAAARPAAAPADLPGAEGGLVLVSALAGSQLRGLGGRVYNVPADGAFYALAADLPRLRAQAIVSEVL